MNRDVLVGAYAAAPSLVSWDPAREAAYLHSVLELPGVRGLELPWPGSLHSHDAPWLLHTLPSTADLVVSDIGHTVSALASDPAFGLASRDHRGRAHAVADAARLRDDVAMLADSAGRARVIAVELHSAPVAMYGDTSALRASLREIAGWNWSGADIVVEHCDTLVPGRTPQKGYLPLEDEIDAATGVAGLSMNWGRSAIELRQPDAVAAQLSRARESGLLRGVIFSGASATDNAYGPAWEDNHPPLAPGPLESGGEATSLLTPARVAEAIAASGDLEWVAVKMGYRPLGAPIDETVRMISHAVDTVTALL